MTLDRGRRAFHGYGLQHVRIERPLHQISDLSDFPCLLFEYPDEFLADDFALPLGIRNPCQPCEEATRGINGLHVQSDLSAKYLSDSLELVLAQEAIVDKHANQPLA